MSRMQKGASRITIGDMSSYRFVIAFNIASKIASLRTSTFDGKKRGKAFLFLLIFLILSAHIFLVVKMPGIIHLFSVCVSIFL